MPKIISDDTLMAAAIQARSLAYARYSGFAVGAALLTESGKIFTGCNVENISLGLTICAERNAVFSAIASGSRKFTRIAICSDSKEPISPCGACRQVLAEFAPDLEIVSSNLQGKIFKCSLSIFLPRPHTGILD